MSNRTFPNQNEKDAAIARQKEVNAKDGANAEGERLLAELQNATIA